MGDFFKPLRRKFGVMTLVLACVFALGWVRSIYYSDDMEFWPTEHFFLQVNSFDSRFHVKCAVEFPGVSVSPTIPMKWVFPLPRSKAIEWDAMPANRISSYRDSVEFDFAEVRLKMANGYQKGHIALVTVPYWSIVIPLTLMSAWLLLIKLRKSTSKKLIEPISEKMA